MPYFFPSAPRLRHAVLPVLLALAVGLCSSVGLAAATPEAFPDLPLNLTPARASALGLSSGGPTSLSRLPAQGLLVLLVSYFCPPCHKEIPRIKDLERRIRERGLAGRIRILALAVGDDQAMVERFLTRHGGLPFPLLPDPDLAAHKRLSSPAVPTLYAVASHRGKLRLLTMHRGEFVEDPDAFLDALLQALAAPPAPAARRR